MKGKLLHQEQAVQGATILLLNKDSIIVKSAVTNTEGEFRLTNIDSGRYMLSITHTGFQPYTTSLMLEDSATVKDLGNISIDRSAAMLQQVVVQGQRPVIEYKTDRVIFNVPEKLHRASRNSFDLLNKAPGVVIGRDDMLQIDGQSNILVTVNGKQRFSSREEAVQFLRNIPADQVMSIEVVHQPSARFDQAASGGVLNIVLKKDETQGLQGSWNGYFNSGTYNRFGSGLNLNYRKKNWNLYAIYNFNRDIQYEQADNRQFISGYVLDQGYNVLRKPEHHNLRVGADVILHKNHVVGVLANITANDQDITRSTGTFYKPVPWTADSLITVDESRTSQYNKRFLNFNYNGSFGNTNPSSLNFDVSYLQDDLRNGSNFLHRYYNSNLVKLRPDFSLQSHIPSIVDLLVFRLEYAKKLKNNFNLEVGMKSTHSSTDNDVQYDTVSNGARVEDIYRTNHYVYRESVNAVYASLSRFGTKTGFAVGLRYEAADIEGSTNGQSTLNRKFNGLFPNLSYRYTINKNNRITVSLRKSVVRPDFIKLNPFVQYLNQNFYYQGNPDLKQFNIYVSSLRYSYKKYSITVRYDYTTDYIPQELFVREGSSFVSKATYANAADLHGLQFTVYVPFERFKWWSSYNNLNVFHTKVRSSDAKFTGLDFINTNASLSSSNVFTLPWKLYGEVNLNMSTNSRNNQTLFKGSYSIDLRLTRTVFNNSLKLTALYEDITYQYVSRGYSEYNGIVNNFYSQKDTRRIGIAASFQFGRKKVADRRQRSVGTEDEENRIKKF